LLSREPVRHSSMSLLLQRSDAWYNESPASSPIWVWDDPLVEDEWGLGRQVA